MKTNRLLAGTFAFVLVAGMGNLAFALDASVINPESTGDSTTNIAVNGDPDIIFDNGAPSNEVLTTVTFAVAADDFIFEDDMILTDVHFWTHESSLDDPWDGTLEYWIFKDDGGAPGEVIDHADGVNVEREDTLFDGFFGDRFEYWFDLETPLELEGGVPYWIGLHLQDDFDTTFFTPAWEGSCVFCGGNAMASVGGIDNFNPQLEHEFAFFLTGHPPAVVGGELLPIDSTALMLAGIQSSAIWMLPVLAGVAGSAFGIIYLKHRKN